MRHIKPSPLILPDPHLSKVTCPCTLKHLSYQRGPARSEREEKAPETKPGNFSKVFFFVSALIVSPSFAEMGEFFFFNILRSLGIVSQQSWDRVSEALRAPGDGEAKSVCCGARAEKGGRGELRGAVNLFFFG